MLRKFFVYAAVWLPALMTFFAFSFLYIDIPPESFMVLYSVWAAMTVFAAIAYIVLLVDLWKNKNLTDNSKVLWTVVLLLVSFPGAFIYFLVVLLQKPSWATPESQGKTGS